MSHGRRAITRRQALAGSAASAAVLATGVWHGRKRGISQELLDVLQWLTMVVVSALYYEPLGRLAASNSSLSLLMAYILAYLAIIGLVKLGFSYIKQLIGDKIVGGDLFGGAGYYLGRVAGGIRFACVLLAMLALLHAKEITAEQRAAQAKMQKDNFGDISFPTIGSVQHAIFYGSLSGRFIGAQLSAQLIAPTAPGKKSVDHQPHNNVLKWKLYDNEAPPNRRQQELDEVFGSKN